MNKNLYLDQWHFKDEIYPSYSVSYDVKRDDKSWECSIGDFVYNKETNQYRFQTEYDPVYITQNEMEQILEMMKGLNARLTQDNQ